MKENDITVPVYLATGFLDSGKTTFFKQTFEDDYFDIDGLTLLILCEEGEEEYDQEILKEKNTVVEVVEEQADFTPKYLKKLEKKYRPERVMLEYNALWGMKNLEEMVMPKGWGIVQQIVCVDASSFMVYMNNLKSLFVDMVRNTDLVVFNRSSRDLDLVNFRRSVKVVNRRAQILFENENGVMLDMMNSAEGFVPYDLNADIIDIADEDFGIFYVDAGENPQKYQGKTVKIHGQVSKSMDPKSDVFVPGRQAMTCCAADMAFIGFLCKSKYTRKLKAGSWVTVTGKINYEYRREYGGQSGPVIYAAKIEKAQPAEFEWVSFT